MFCCRPLCTCRISIARDFLWEFYRSHCGIYYRLGISIGTLSHSLFAHSIAPYSVA